MSGLQKILKNFSKMPSLGTKIALSHNIVDIFNSLSLNIHPKNGTRECGLGTSKRLLTTNRINNATTNKNTNEEYLTTNLTNATNSYLDICLKTQAVPLGITMLLLISQDLKVKNDFLTTSSCWFVLVRGLKSSSHSLKTRSLYA